MEHLSDHCLIRRIREGVLTLCFNAKSPHNPFSAEMERAVTEALRAAGGDPEIRAVVLSGGSERSFSVGGDFNEVKEFEGGAEVDRWIEDVVEMYVACLELEKPTVAALDNYAIGIGFQLALCCDYRLGTGRCTLIMPELKNGVACSLGQAMLERMLGRAQMQRIVIECERFGPEESLRLGLLNAVCEPGALLDQAEQVAARLGGYPRVSYGATKRTMNRPFVEALRRITPIAQRDHRASFKDRAAQRFMTEILGGR